MQMAFLYASDFPFKNFCKLAQHAETIQKRSGKQQWRVLVVDKSTDNDKPHFNLFFTTISTSKNFFSERELKKALRDILKVLTGVWTLVDNGLVIFDWFVLSIRMQVILDSLFARPDSALAPVWGGKKGEFRDWTMFYGEHFLFKLSPFKLCGVYPKFYKSLLWRSKGWGGK